MQTQKKRSLPRVAHLLRPALGGMRELVRTLLLASETWEPALLIAPEDTLANLADTVPNSERRQVLRAESAAPHHQIAAGQSAGRWAKQRGAQILHGHGLRYAPLFASASVASGLPLVVSLHNLVPSDMNGLQKAAARTALSRASTVIAISDAVARSASDLISDKARLQTIPNGIAISRFTTSAEERNSRRKSLRESLCISESAPVIVCLSRLSPEKDVTNLLEAFSRCVVTFPEARLLIAGEGRLRNTLEWHIQLLGLTGKAMLLGAYPRERVADLLFAADVFALSSREEGLSLAVLEAMASGLPIVATHIGGLPEATPHEETGLLVPPRDPVAFSQALQQLLGHPEQGHIFGDEGKRRVARLFNDTKMIEATFAVYEHMVHDR